MAICTQTVVGRHKYFDLMPANGDLKGFDVLKPEENRKTSKKPILSTFCIYIYVKKNFFRGSKNRKNRFFLNVPKSILDMCRGI